MLKILKIKDQKALDKFYRKLFFYKSFIFKKIYFKVETDYKEIKPIITALNIKKRKERITYIYDEACTQIDNHYNNKNICGFKNNKCYVQQKLNNGVINGCCRMCKYQSEKRCQIITFDDLKILNLLSLRNKMILKSDYFSKREDVINDLYYGSFLIWTVRIVIRLINNFYTVKKLKTSFHHFL